MNTIIITNANLVAMHKTLCDSFEQQLKPFPFKKNIRDALIDGFRAGSKQGIAHIVKMLNVEVQK